jgi:hypothetical protein
MGRIFNFFVRLLSGLNFNDTQCGFKVFRNSSLKILVPHLSIDRFAWDVELLMLAQRHNMNIQEKAVTWRFEKNSSVRMIQDSLEMIKSILKIRFKKYIFSKQ